VKRRFILLWNGFMGFGRRDLPDLRNGCINAGDILDILQSGGTVHIVQPDRLPWNQETHAA